MEKPSGFDVLDPEAQDRKMRKAIEKLRTVLRVELRRRRDSAPQSERHLFDELIKRADRGHLLDARCAPHARITDDNGA